MNRRQARAGPTAFYRSVTDLKRRADELLRRVLLTLAGVAACGGSLADGGNVESFGSMAARAEASITRARELGNVWADTAGTLERARRLAASGDMDAAMQAAARAGAEAELAVEQSLLERARYVHGRLTSLRGDPPAAELDLLWRMILARHAEEASRLADRLLERHGP